MTRVETRVEHAEAGDLLVEFEYSGYQNMNGVQVPSRIVQRQAGLQTFDAAISAATPNPANLTELLAPHRRRRVVAAAGAPAQQAAGPAGVRSLETACSRSAATTAPSPWTWATTSSSSKAARATSAAVR